MEQKIWTIGSILSWTEQYFKRQQVESPRLDAEVLLAHVLGKERIYLYVHFDEPLEERELALYREFIKKRAKKMPVAYITGKKEFMGLEFAVSRDVLVPRPDTEILVQAVLDRLPAEKQEIADIGTGSGAILLSLLHYRPQWLGTAVDISAKALATAKNNGVNLGLQERAEFLEGDMLAPLQARKFAAIISNPPYIPLADYEKLMPDVKEYEPRHALTDEGDGLKFYRELVNNSPAHLQSGGFLAVEAGIHEARQIEELLQENHGYGKIEIIKDLAGIERVVIGWLNDRGGTQSAD